MTQLFEPPARTGAIVAVRNERTGDRGVNDEPGVVHAARLVDTGRGGLEPILPVCDALINVTRTDEPITCEICLIRLRPDAFTKAHRRARRVMRGWLRQT